VNTEHRKNPRQNVQLDVELSFPMGGKQIVSTRDFSEHGVFLTIDKNRCPEIGEVVAVTIIKDEHNTGVSFPSNDAVVVHHSKNGIGLAFIELDF